MVVFLSDVGLKMAGEIILKSSGRRVTLVRNIFRKLTFLEFWGFGFFGFVWSIWAEFGIFFARKLLKHGFKEFLLGILTWASKFQNFDFLNQCCYNIGRHNGFSYGYFDTG